MSQSRGMSLVEAGANVIIGWLVAVCTQLVAFPVVGLQAAPAQHVALSLVFTFVSFLRSFLLRRVFERLRPGFSSSKTGAGDA